MKLTYTINTAVIATSLKCLDEIGFEDNIGNMSGTGNINNNMGNMNMNSGNQNNTNHRNSNFNQANNYGGAYPSFK